MAHYFAYGSNLSRARLEARIGPVRVIGAAAVADHDVRFWKPGVDGTGKATLVERPQMCAHGVIYRLVDAQLRELDALEGEAFGYRVVTIPARLAEVPAGATHDPEARVPTGGRADEADAAEGTPGRTVAARAYVAGRLDPCARPADWYRELTVAGAAEHDLPPTWIASLRRAGDE